MSTPRKPRRKTKKHGAETGTPSSTVPSSAGTPTRPTKQPRKASGSARLVNDRNSPLHDTPLADFLAPFRPASTQWVARYTYVSFAIILRAAVGLGPFSGYKSEPLHGDFEAQRHWMEITTSLPLKEWYFHDLEWWGLDYPPLTAFHSWLFGQIGSWWNPSWYVLYDSRGLETDNLKSYMRATAIFSETCLYVPGVIWFVRWWGKVHHLTPVAQSFVSAAILFQPALILIDHGHFQYNSVMLGFTLLAVVNIYYDNYMLASFLFVMALSFKQMALYYAPVIFAYLLGICFKPRLNTLRFLSIAIVVLLSFSTMLAPFLMAGGVEQVKQIGIRVFPFQRGLWEDKVANLWCTLNVFIKFKYLFTSKQLQLYSLILTAVSILPTMLLTGIYAKKQILPWALSACAWAFYLFSFQVHEKSVLLPLMPTTLLLVSSNIDEVGLIIWINNMASYSLYPLLAREGLKLQFFVIVFCWNWLLGFKFPRNKLYRLIICLYYVVVAILSLLQAFPQPQIQQLIDTKYSDLWVVLNCLVSFSAFSLYWLWNLMKLYKYATATTTMSATA